jgi:hypothetical protein
MPAASSRHQPGGGIGAPRFAIAAAARLRLSRPARRYDAPLA